MVKATFFEASLCAALAQLVEHRIRNAGVVGSNPISGTITDFRSDSPGGFGLGSTYIKRRGPDRQVDTKLTRLTPILKLIAIRGIDNILHRGYFVILCFRKSYCEGCNLIANNVKELGPEQAAMPPVPRTNPTLQACKRILCCWTFPLSHHFSGDSCYHSLPRHDQSSVAISAGKSSFVWPIYCSGQWKKGRTAPAVRHRSTRSKSASA